MSGDALVTILAAFAVAAIAHVWLALGLSRLFVKLGEAGRPAWVPFLNIATLLRLADISAGWAVTLVVPPACVAGIVMVFVAAHRVSVSFGRGSATTVLAVLCLPLWASVLGFGAAAPIGGAQSRLAPYRPSYGLSGVAAPPTPAWVSELTLPTSLAAVNALAAEKVEMRPLASLPAELVRAAEAALNGSASEVSRAPDKVSTAPGSAARVTDKEVWILTPEHGASIALTAGAALLGRNPARGNNDDVQIVELADPAKTVSKTHARIDLTGEQWSIIDLGSTNGVYLRAAEGGEIELKPGMAIPLGDCFRLGDLTITLRKVTA